MPVRNYGVLKGRVMDRSIEYEHGSPHYQVRVAAAGKDFRVAVNVKSADRSRPELLFYVAENFRHVILEGLPALEEGFHHLERRPDTLALDYIRGNLLDRRKMVPLPADLPGEENDLNEKLEIYLRRAVGHPDAFLYAFGSRWGPERRRDKVFKFVPGNGVHNIHMNQGNPPGRNARDNGCYQDGALFLHYPTQDRWVALFLAFQSQVWHTDDKCGGPHAAVESYGPAYRPTREEPDYRVRIMAAQVNPPGPDFGRETVTLFNTTDEPVNLDGWHLMDRGKRKMRLAGVLPPSMPLTIMLSGDINLSNSGGIITLLDPRGLKVHGVHYTRRMAAEEGRTLVF